MKHHINIVIIALRVILFAAAVMCFINLIKTYEFFFTTDIDKLYSYFDNHFTPIDAVTLNNRKLLSASHITNLKWVAIGFTLCYTALLMYGMSGIVRFYKCLLKIEKNQIFYHEQGAQFRKVGATVIIFAKVKYVLFCFAGILSYFDISQFFKQIPMLLSLYLIGKLILIMSYMAERGEFIKEENDLTV
ncbi:DUF2975 domain-containing protein [Flavobacterium sp. DG1-102-2]|uniref:DUF2975 domain-containing protein n=1 Tax=Flavobacterium sp. DG1-102-2 TaxID=3081663 RepID=UPI00294A4B61|nr:DUF2975 domain-containing protein [Flavobacterium sp. DG1-102-2]MDV6167547.1 DUF2975 domain-containing protein [Flavobacterium sp. DG1-102-2]